MEMMNKLFNRVVPPLQALPNFARIVRKVTDLKNSNNYAMLYPLLYLLDQDLFVGTKEELITSGLLEPTFNEVSLVNLCQQTWLQLQPGETVRDRPHPPSNNVFAIVKNGRDVFSVKYVILKEAGGYVTDIYLNTPYPSIEVIVNNLPPLLYQFCLIMNPTPDFEKIRFKWGNLSVEYKRVVQTIYGSREQNSTKTKLKEHLLFLQDDLGFYRLNKTKEEYFEHLTEKTVFIVFSTKPLKQSNLLSPYKLEAEDIETWTTGYIIINTANLFYSIEKQNNDVHKYPWIYTAGEPTVFAGRTHLKMELICRRKSSVELQGIGFTLMSYFFGYFASNYPNLSMVLVDVARTHGSQGLPDLMFTQLLHERFKFQRTFPLVLENTQGLYTAPEFEYLSTVLQNMFEVEQHPPYLKEYKNNISPAVLQKEFPNLPPGDAISQDVLEQYAVNLTFARPMFTQDDVQSIFQRFIQSNIETVRRVPRGTLQSYTV